MPLILCGPLRLYITLDAYCSWRSLAAMPHITLYRAEAQWKRREGAENCQQERRDISIVTKNSTFLAISRRPTVS